MIRRRKSSEINARVAVAKALSAVRQSLLKVKIQERRLEMIVKRDPIARSVLENLYEVEHLLEFVSLRLETLAVTGIVPLNELKVPLKVLKKVTEVLGGSPPDILSLLSQAEEALKEAFENHIYASAPQEMFLSSTESLNRDVENILNEAKVVAEHRLEEALSR